ncbi:MAG: hypothetical protein OXR70_07725 [Candidatus Marinimicrobia bacterium]|nr:hypothetical protein [Candidatus Neomarinimicrobiota bacterium]MDD9888022.1 hypothetical protein [Candidatus Neomarinimicrobiota bacterium]MDD9931739.1 hypothetical protein [Candidatus Neomarinimicrobiota bacterium]
MRRFASICISFIIWVGCASHPVVNPHLPEPGKVKKGYALSTENVFPYMWYRKGLTDKSEIGFRVGLPIYGSGIDYSRVVYQKENKWDLINLAWSVNPNFNMDATYYKFKTKKGNDGFIKSRWWGIRGMFIPNGITNHTSNRLGILMGFQGNPRWGMEFGYFHDPTSMPITQLFNPKWDPAAEGISKRFEDKPMKDSATGFPSEYSRLTGLHISIFFDLDALKKEK